MKCRAARQTPHRNVSRGFVVSCTQNEYEMNSKGMSANPEPSSLSLYASLSLPALALKINKGARTDSCSILLQSLGRLNEVAVFWAVSIGKVLCIDELKTIPGSTEQALSD